MSIVTHDVIGTSFADPADVRRFQSCKAAGGSDSRCFKVGDNGIGKWGSPTVEGSGPCVALPPEDWQHLKKPNKTKIIVRCPRTNRSVLCELRDTMPPKAEISNGAGIDMNPDAIRLLNLTIPAKERVTWRFAEPQ